MKVSVNFKNVFLYWMMLVMNENFVRLSVNEIEVLMEALQLIDTKDEDLIHQKTDVSLPSLYNKLYSTVEKLQND
jgi:hypothetical protein